MKILSVIKKSVREQIRSYWLLALTISMGPFFVVMYYLFTAASGPHYKVLFLNQDLVSPSSSIGSGYGEQLIELAGTLEISGFDLPIEVGVVDNKPEALNKIKNNKADLLIIVHEGFSAKIGEMVLHGTTQSVVVEFVGDLSKTNYMVSAVWANELLNDFIFKTIRKTKPVSIKETSLVKAGGLDEFSLYVPGLLVLSIIMLMFSASIALVTEVEHKTLFRLALSKISTFQFIIGVVIVQIGIGVMSVLVTLFTAVGLGFKIVGPLPLTILIVVLTSISIIAFSLILAAATKSGNEVLIAGNFPLFLFMFFTGAIFPLNSMELFQIADYSFTLSGFMSPTHAISAIKKVLVLNMGLNDVLPEILIMLFLTVIYFLAGLWAFRRRHMKSS